MELKITKLHPNAILPSFAHEGDAGMDLYVHRVIEETANQITYGLGIAVKIPDNHAGLIFPRSSIRKYDLMLSNSVGVIDSGYIGELQVTFNKTQASYIACYDGPASIPSQDFHKLYDIDERCCQLVVLPLARFDIKEVDSLSNITTTRGEGGFGSTGTH